MSFQSWALRVTARVYQGRHESTAKVDAGSPACYVGKHRTDEATR